VPLYRIKITIPLKKTYPGYFFQCGCGELMCGCGDPLAQGGGVPRPRVPFYKKSIILKIQREDQDKMVRGYPDPRRFRQSSYYYFYYLPESFSVNGNTNRIS
jgi:hypothetical protein